MNSDALSIGTTGSLVANLLLLAVMENVSEPPWWRGNSNPYEPTWVGGRAGPYLLDTWRPFIDDVGGGGYRRRNCPQPRDRSGRQRLADAPLPPGYNPHTPREEPFHACILVRSNGTIEAVRLIGSTGTAALDARLIGMIAARWRVAGGGTAGGPTWHRVRLDSGPDEGEVLDPAAIY